MRSFQISLGVIFMFFSSAAWAQGFVENALLFSRTKPGGSARIQAMGGAQIALGGDYSSALSNPAGLGMYNRSEFTFSPAVNFYGTTSTHLGNEMDDSKTVFNIPGLSYVHHSPVDKGGFLGGSFAVSMSRINDFQNTFQYGGKDNASSIIDYFEQQAQGHHVMNEPLPACVDCDSFGSDFDSRNTPPLPFDIPVDLAYQTFLINPYADGDYPNPFTKEDYLDYTTYFSELDTLGSDEIRTLNRSGNNNLRGAQYQWSFAYGGNFKDKLFFGASVGLTTLRYKYSSSYSESNFIYSSGYESPLDDLQLKENFEVDGTGLNLTLGLIYRFIDFAQVGISFVTPTYYTINDTYNTNLTANWNIRPDQEASSQPIISEYNIITPMKLNTGLAIFVSKYGIISGDVEFVNYGKARYDSDTPGVSFAPENDDIKFYYDNVVNYRIGAEGRLDIFRIRAGYNVQNNPYKNINYESSTTTFSAGVGVKWVKFFIDGTWLNTKYNSTYIPYSVVNGPIVNLKNTLNSAMLTVGFSF